MDREEYNWYGAMLEYLGQEPGRRFMRQLATLDPVFHKGHTLIAQLLAAGEFSLAIVYPHRVESMKKQVLRSSGFLRQNRSLRRWAR